MFRHFLKFGLVGAFGLATNLIVFYLCNLKFHFNVAMTIAFLVAVSQNYYFNSSWTFEARFSGFLSRFQGWIKYVFVNLAGFFINFIVLNLVVWGFGESFALGGQFLGVAIAFTFNFGFSKFWVFQTQSQG